MFYILVTINVYFFQCWIPNYRILCNYIHIRFFKLGSFNLFLLYRGLWNTKEIRFFFFNKWVVNEMRTSSVSEGAKIEHINLRKHQKYTLASREKIAKISQFMVVIMKKKSSIDIILDCQRIQRSSVATLWFLCY
jgi:hypothetical protein